MAAADVAKPLSTAFSSQTSRYDTISRTPSSFERAHRATRFQTTGMHPELLTSMQLQSSPHVGPGTYELMQYGDFSARNLEKRMQGPNWHRAHHTEQMAKIPHSSFKETYERRKENERRIGPGAYPINDFLTEAERRPHCARGALDQLTPRFPKENLVGNGFSGRLLRTRSSLCTESSTATGRVWHSRPEGRRETLEAGQYRSLVRMEPRSPIASSRSTSCNECERCLHSNDHLGLEDRTGNVQRQELHRRTAREARERERPLSAVHHQPLSADLDGTPRRAGPMGSLSRLSLEELSRLDLVHVLADEDATRHVQQAGSIPEEANGSRVHRPSRSRAEERRLSRPGRLRSHATVGTTGLSYEASAVQHLRLAKRQTFVH